MKWKRKYTIGLIVIVEVVIIFATILITRTVLSPKPSTKQTNLLKLTSGHHYDIVGEIGMYGMHINNDKLDNILKKKTRNGIDVYTYIFDNGELPEEFAEELKLALRPGFAAQTTDEMYVTLDLAVNGATKKIKVKTGDWVTTFTYFVLATKGNCVFFLAGDSPDSKTTIIGTRTFQCSKVYSIGDIVAGTPYNFSPTTKTVFEFSPPTPGKLSIPPIN